MNSGNQQTIKHRFRDGVFWAGCCVVIAVVAFWCPSFNSYLRADPDPRVGPAILLGLVAIAATAFRATDKLCCAYEDSPVTGRRKHLPWIALMIVLCWSPAMVWAFSAVRALMRAYAR